MHTFNIVILTCLERVTDFSQILECKFEHFTWPPTTLRWVFYQLSISPFVLSYAVRKLDSGPL